MRHKFIGILWFTVLFVMPALTLGLTRGIEVTDRDGRSISLYKDYQAMVVGISHYEKWPKLPDATHDAREVAAKLTEAGFTVKLVLDPSASELRTALNEMVYDMGAQVDRAVLFYFAGHGETEVLADQTKMGYIIPRDCPLLKKDPKGFAGHAISMRDIESASLRIRAKHVLMLFDSCFSGSLFSLVRAVPHDITEKSALPVRQYITAGREDEQVPDKSMFKRCLLLGLDGDADLTGDGYITGSELGMYLSDSVVNYTHRRQHPQFGKINNPDLDRGDFIFLSSKARQKAKGEERKAEEESALSEELRKLREERKRSEELVKQLEQLLQTRSQSEDKEKALKAEKKEIEDRLRRTEQELQEKDQKSATMTQMEADRKALEGRLRREADEKKALEAELKRLRAEQEQAAQIAKEAPGSKEREAQVAALPKEVKGPQLQKARVTLRATPTELNELGIEKMISKYNFYAKHRNEEGDFSNDFVDNADGTITDRATGLTWEKAGSVSALYEHEIRAHLEGLNKQRLAGHGNWRLPTLEELFSLLVRAPNKRGLHTSDLFDEKQSECWSADPLEFDIHGNIPAYHAVDFRGGGPRPGATGKSHDPRFGQPRSKLFVRAVVSPSAAAQKAGAVQEKKAQGSRVASIHPEVKSPEAQKKRILLRSKARELNSSDVEKMISKYHFFDKMRNEGGGFPNDLVDNGDGTITDNTTGLMWQKGGSPSPLFPSQIQSFLDHLNKEKFAGHADWRLPTLEEIYSLLNPKANGRDLFISDLFDAGQSEYWSADHIKSSWQYEIISYYAVLFANGWVETRDTGAPSRMGDSSRPTSCSVRAVRSLRP